MFEYIIYLCECIKNYLKFDNISYKFIYTLSYKSPYKLPFDIKEIEKDGEFIQFKNNNDVNEIIFALNNLPEVLHKLIFKEFTNVSNTYFFVTLKFYKNQINEIFHNLDKLNNCFCQDSIDFILIRLNLIKNDSKLDHINGIFINKKQRYIFIFEPKSTFLFDTNQLVLFLKDFFDFSDFILIYPNDIGYNSSNSLQKYDAFCQTYVLFTFLLIVFNENIHYSKLSIMLNSLITYKNLGFFLFFLNKLLKANNFEIHKQSNLWNYPTNKTQNILNIINLFFNKEISDNSEINFEVQEDTDLFIIQ